MYYSTAICVLSLVKHLPKCILLNYGFEHKECTCRHFHMVVSVLEARNLLTSSTTDLRLLLQVSDMT